MAPQPQAGSAARVAACGCVSPSPRKPAATPRQGRAGASPGERDPEPGSNADRRLAAIATTNGAALFYGFGNFCALAAHARPRVDAAHQPPQGPPARPGRQRDQPIPRGAHRRVRLGPVARPRERSRSVMADFLAARPDRLPRPGVADRARAPDGGRRRHPHRAADLARRRAALQRPRRRDPRPLRRGPAVHHLGEHVEQRLRAGRGRALRDARDPRGVRPSPRGGADRPRRRAAANRLLYRYHLPCSTSIVAFHTRRRWCSSATARCRIERRAGGRRPPRARAGVAPGAHERVPVRWPSAEALRQYAA